ncbi:hypothetical protein RISK_002960 [Rhodopirellula islandica]|uniref:Uncharacterized protein n=1 Tax=Rhodopirellula islandica TaxID=595434 RepID=A0A0J1BEE8_RHOIS|nr:hypothetical protein RISK_002960 [Rhodopirellula islandica]
MATRTQALETLSFYLIGDPSILEPSISLDKTFARLKGVCYLRRRKFGFSALIG